MKEKLSHFALQDSSLLFSKLKVFLRTSWVSTFINSKVLPVHVCECVYVCICTYVCTYRYIMYVCTYIYVYMYVLVIRHAYIMPE